MAMLNESVGPAYLCSSVFISVYLWAPECETGFSHDRMRPLVVVYSRGVDDASSSNYSLDVSDITMQA
jgi:hypothetical protein